MSDRELVDEVSRSLDDLSHAGWQAVHEEVRRRGLRVRPWRDEHVVLVTTANKVAGFGVHRTIAGDVIAAAAARRTPADSAARRHPHPSRFPGITSHT